MADSTTQSVRKAISKLNETVMAIMYLSTNVSGLTASSWNKISFDKVSYDVGKNYDTSSHRFVVPVTGLYKIRGAVTFTSVIATQQYSAAIYINGASVKEASQHSSKIADLTVITETELFLQQNDYLEFYVNPLAGANTVAALSGSKYTTLNVRLITKEGIRQ